VPQLAAYILKLEQKLRGIIDWGDAGAHDARAAWLQRVRSVQSHCLAKTPPLLADQSWGRCHECLA